MSSAPNPFLDEKPVKTQSPQRKPVTQSLLRGLFAPLFHPMSVVMLIALLGLGVLLAIFSNYFFLAYLAFFAVYVFERTAGGSDTLDELPEFELFDGAIYYLWFAYVAIISIMPGTMLGAALASGIASEQNAWISLSCVTASFLLFAPILFLSGMLNMSPWVLFNREVISSIRDIPWVWTRFYLLSFVFWMLLSVSSLIAVACVQQWTDENVHSSAQSFLISGTLALCYILNFVGYFRLLGCLARIISDWLGSQDDQDDE